MAKINDKPITSEDISEYLNQKDDFDLEMRTLKTSIKIGLECRHGGTYIDPVMDKPRQYDIRAKYISNYISIKFAIECKAITPSFPLVISRTPRINNESYNTVSITRYKGWDGARSHKIVELNSLYTPMQPTGKSSNQLGIKNDGSFLSNDSEIYDKWAQAIASSYDLLSEFIYLDNKEYRACSVFPILVVPDNTLWCVDYDPDGTMIGKPIEIDQCDYYIGREYYFNLTSHQLCYNISHLHIVTSSHYESLIKRIILKVKQQSCSILNDVNSEN